MTKLIRFALFGLLSILALLVVLKIGSYGWQEFTTRQVHHEFVAAHPEVMQLPAGERVAFKARQILANLSQSRYSHWTKVEEENGLYELDCSGMVCFILRNVAPKALRTVPTAWSAHRPRAKCFQQVFAEEP